MSGQTLAQVFAPRVTTKMLVDLTMRNEVAEVAAFLTELGLTVEHDGGFITVAESDTWCYSTAFGPIARALNLADIAPGGEAAYPDTYDAIVERCRAEDAAQAAPTPPQPQEREEPAMTDVATIEAPPAATDLPRGGTPVAVDPAHLFRRPANIPERCEAHAATIVPGRWQPRRVFDEAKLDELAASLKEHGMLTPVKVFYNEAGKFELIAGERRWRAAQRVPLLAIPVEVVEWTAAQIQEVSIIDNLQREDLTPLEEGAAFEMAIQQLGLSEAALAKRMGVSRAHVQQRRAFARATPGLRQALGEVEGFTLSVARGILAGSGGDEEVERKATERIVEELVDGTLHTEASAREAAMAVLWELRLPALLQLGWREAKFHWEGEWLAGIYSCDDAPRDWTAREMLDAIRDQRRPELPAPDPAPMPGDAPDAVRRVLMGAGMNWRRDYAPPWILVWSVGGSGAEPRWMQMLDLELYAAQLENQVAQVQQRYLAQGLSLEQRDVWVHWTVRMADGRMTEFVRLKWEEVTRLIAQVEAGEVTIEALPNATPATETGAGAQAAPAGAPQTRECLGCGTALGFTGWQHKSGPRGYGPYCNACLKGYKEAERAASKQAGLAVAAALHPLLAQATLPQLRLLALLLGAANSDNLGKKTEMMVRDEGALRNWLADRIGPFLWETRYPATRPFVEEILASLKGPSEESAA